MHAELLFLAIGLTGGAIAGLCLGAAIWNRHLCSLEDEYNRTKADLDEVSENYKKTVARYNGIIAEKNDRIRKLEADKDEMHKVIVTMNSTEFLKVGEHFEQGDALFGGF